MTTTYPIATRPRRLPAATVAWFVLVAQVVVVAEAVADALLADLVPGAAAHAPRRPSRAWPAALAELLSPLNRVPAAVTIGGTVARVLLSLLLSLVEKADTFGSHGIRQTGPVLARSAYALECAHKTMVAHDGRRPSSYRTRLGDISEDRSARDRGGRTAAHGV
jgi:hypothetical protein